MAMCEKLIFIDSLWLGKAPNKNTPLWQYIVYLSTQRYVEKGKKFTGCLRRGMSWVQKGVNMSLHRQDRGLTYLCVDSIMYELYIY